MTVPAKGRAKATPMAPLYHLEVSLSGANPLVRRRRADLRRPGGP